jgi:heat shock protein HslJ
VDSLNPVVAEEGDLTLGTDGRYTGISACTEFSGTYEVKGNQIIFGPWDSGSKFCPEPQMTQESTVYDTISNHTVDYKIEGNTLTLTRPLSGSDFVLVFEAVTDSTGN